MACFVYTPAMENWMREHYLLRLDTLTLAFNQQFHVTRSSEAINALRKRLKLKTGRSGCFTQGHSPANKGKKGLTGANTGSFKKNHRPHNDLPIGSEVVTQDGYVKVKVAIPSKWKLKHRLVWEQHHGPIPKSGVIKFIDDNKQNCVIENLMLVSKPEHGVINRYYPHAPAEYKPTTVQLARLKIAIRDKTRGQTNA
ncbi:HNH endonuclease signature motif containing protein [Xenorhabdus sp. XENO-7]|uniref:HNH endonuclease signature motif containing protein n=1 Tax=Xenorhabdus aichiensis TaxID=3025874 RepID=A0ABT5LZI6_9GAMM|nr:HNH endonuclease signature motif containing protein [Xenorhabdus aichiensis]MDC9620839.1 HNH endonuclease signature motif containing protein [Xenorhabdus aichiensis]